MSALNELEKKLESLTRAEKVQLLQWVVRDLGDAFPGIESQPGVCGGEPCIVRTRIPVWVLHEMHRQGVREADILRSYPSLRAEDLANAWLTCGRIAKRLKRRSGSTRRPKGGSLVRGPFGSSGER